MAQHIFTGASAPSSVPTKVGQHYIDTTNKIHYLSVGTSLVADWKITDADAAIAAHVAAADPHPTYLTATEGNAAYDSIGSAAAAQAFSIQRSNHTGTQLASTISDFASTVRSTVLTGFAVGSAVAIAAADTILQAFGKVQALINDLQAQIDVWTENVLLSVLTNSSNTTLTNITDLSLTVVAGKYYRIEGMLLYRSAATTTGITFTFGNTTATGTLSVRVSTQTGADGQGNANSAYDGQVTAFGDVVTTPSVQAINTDYILNFTGVFVCTVSGTITPQFRSEVNGSQITVQPGSNIIAREF